MAFTDVLARVKTHATTAGAGLTRPLTNVAIGYPKAADRAVRIFWGGETKPVRMGESDEVLNGKMVSDLIVVIVFWAIATLSDDTAQVIELEARAFTAAFRTAVLGDPKLNGQITDLYLGHGETDFPQLAGSVWRTVTFELTADFTEYAIVSP